MRLHTGNAIVAPRETGRDAARGELFRVLGRHNVAEPKGNARKRFRMGDLEKTRGDRPASVIPNFDVVFIFRFCLTRCVRQMYFPD
jgi:hypothetical protein